jgi:hypothetical protein
MGIIDNIERRTKSTIRSRVRAEPIPQSEFPNSFPSGNMFRHQFGQSLILRLHIPFQMGNSFLFSPMVGSSSLPKNCGSVLLLSAAVYRRDGFRTDFPPT